MSDYNNLSSAYDVNPFKKSAFFDGIYLKTDSFENQSSERVLPILAEEQMFICRQMIEPIQQLQRSLGTSLNVLDIGTGSGVFAIYADKLLNRKPNKDQKPSQILALDCSQRALEFAQKNSKFNNCENLKIIEPPQFYSDQVFDNQGKTILEKSQHLILINPPFSPTYCESKDNVALHSASGQDGMRVLREWMEFIPEHLHPKGMVIGYHMSLVSKEGEIVVLKEIQRYFTQKTKIEYCRVFPKDINTQNFLESVYQDFSTNQEDQKQHRLQKWIDKLSKKYPKLALIYYQVKLLDSSQSEITETLTPVFTEYDMGENNWKIRAYYHKIALNCSNSIVSSSALADINLEQSEKVIKQITSRARNKNIFSSYEEIQEQKKLLRKFISKPLIKYLENKLLHHAYKNQNIDWFTQNLNFLFGEFIFICPYDSNTPWEWLQISVAICFNPIAQERLEQLIQEYHYFLDTAYESKQSMMFSCEFRESKRADQWTPLEGANEDYLIVFSSDCDSAKDSLLVNELLLDHQKKLSSKNIYGDHQIMDNIEDGKYTSVTLNPIMPIDKDSKTFNSVQETMKNIQCLIDTNLQSSLETVSFAVPIYTKNQDEPSFQITGGCYFFAEFNNSKLDQSQKQTAKKIISSLIPDIRSDLMPIMAGYAYQRGRDQLFLQQWSLIYHEVSPLIIAIDKKMPVKVLMAIQLSFALHYSYNPDNDSLPQTVLSILKKYFREYLVNDVSSEDFIKELIWIASIPNLIKTSRIDLESYEDEDEDNQKIIEEKILSEVDTWLDILYKNDIIHINTDSFKLDITRKDLSDNFRVAITLLFCAVSNCFKHCLTENPKIHILIQNDKVRISNSCIYQQKIHRTGETKLYLNTKAQEYGNEVKKSIIYQYIKFSDLISLENEWWQSQNYDQEYVWLTEFQFVLK